MNKDVDTIFESYIKKITESPVATDPVAQVDAVFANGPGQDAETLQQQVQALAAAQDAIKQQVEQLNMAQDKVRGQVEQGLAVPMDPSGVTQVEAQIGKLNDQMTQLSQLAQSIAAPAQQMGVNLTPIMESFENLMKTLQEHANWYVRCLIPEKTGYSLHKRHALKRMIFENNIPRVEALLEEGDDNYLRDVLGMEPEDFEHEDPDQAAMDRQDAVELARHDRPSAGPEDGLMGDVEALERLLDDETRAVMDDEGGTMSRREAREVAKDIIKQMIDRL